MISIPRVIGGVILALCLAMPVLAQSDDVKLKELVDKAAALVQEKGTEYGFKVLNASAGPFRQGELYVFAVGFDGRTLAHPINPDLRGKPHIDLKDARGKYFIREFVETAREQGSGWIEYWWLRHGEKEPTLKRAYVKRVAGSEVLVGAGYYVK